jgi:peptide/nickel transport system substrate-binding protein
MMNDELGIHHSFLSRRELLLHCALSVGDMALARAGVPSLLKPEAAEAMDQSQGNGSLPVAEPRRGGRLIICFPLGNPRHFNPAVASGVTALPGTQIFASPLRFDEKWQPQPYLAKSWEISKDGLSVTLRLIEGATFHDGRPITSDDVAFSVLAVKTYHPFQSMFAPVERVDTPDPHTAVIQLARPHPAILLAMSPALLPILPRHVYGDGQDLKTHPANLAPVGSGPFKLVKYVPESFVLLERFNDFLIPGRPYLDEVEIRFQGDLNVQLLEVERREAHVLYPLSDPFSLDRLNRCKHLFVRSLDNSALGLLNWLAFNFLRKPLDDKRVRQAIAYAIDPDFIVNYLHRGRSIRATGPITPASPFYDPNLLTYEVDLARAGRLLDEAGYPLKPNGRRFALNLDYMPGRPDQQRDVAFYLRRQLAQVGIELRIRHSATFSEWTEHIGNWDFDMTLDCVYNWGDPVIGVHRTYLSTNIRQGVVWSNTQNYRNPRVDELLEQAGVEMDTVRRKALYAEFQKIVAEELPVVWINVVPSHVVYDRGLRPPSLSIWGMLSPLDEWCWETPPTSATIPPPPLEGDQAIPRVKVVGVRAIKLLQEVGLHRAGDVFKDPEQGFLDLSGSGLHVVGFTTEGFVFFDNSGQMKPGMDISGILDPEGNTLLPQLVAAAGGKNGGYFSARGVLPHPATHKTDPMSAWCGLLRETDVVCALEWPEDKGGET